MFEVDDSFTGAWVDAHGRIVSELRCSWAMVLAQSRDNLILIPGKYDAATTYFVERDPVPRPVAVPVDEAHIVPADGATVLGIEVPAGTEMRDGGRVLGEVGEEAVFEFVTSKPGTYTFELRPPFPYQRQTITVTAHAP